MSEIRTRFAPSPTGALHAGTVRTALFAWLVAKHNDGKFILRIEDTDQARSVEGGVNNIIESLHYVGIEWDAGPDKPADYGPFIQSERLDSYKVYANKLINAGLAYADPYSIEELQELRDKAKSEHKPFLYRNHRPENPLVWDGSQPLRLRSDPKVYKWKDAVMGDMSASAEAIDDFIIIKSDGFPTYNFAHIIDDLAMSITHVIRSQEFISSMPRFLNLYEALGIEYPIFATLPPVLNETGKRKLSKREGAKQILEYKQMGIMPEALINFLALLGWNDGTTQEIFTTQEIIDKFELSRVQKSGAQFNENHLIYTNGVFIRNLELEELYKRVANFWPSAAKSYEEDYKKKVLNLVQERLKYFAELSDLTIFFFEDLPVNLGLIENNKQLSKFTHDDLKELLVKAKVSLEENDFSLESLTSSLNKLLEETNQKPAVLFSLIRVATTQAPASPGLAESLGVLGKDRSLARLDVMINSL